MTSSPAVERFWNWFTENHASISDAYYASDVTWLNSNLSRRVGSLAPNLNWEIGPYNEPDETFVLSPTVRENLAFTRAAVGICPNLDGWHFLHAKPGKELTRLVFEASDHIVDAEDWQYQLVAYNHREFVDIEIFMTIDGVPASIEDLFSELVVEALVGEEMRLDRVGLIQPTFVDDIAAIENGTPIRYLYDHLQSVFDFTQDLP